MKDLQTLTTIAEEEGNPVVSQEAWAQWQNMALEFWQPKTATDKRTKGTHRKNVLRWLKTTGHALLVGTGQHWGAYAVEDELEDPATWPSIACAVDQGGDGWSGLHYLIATNHNVLPLADASHRTWNDAQLALQSSGLKWVVLATTVCLNTDSGPWAGQKWFVVLQEAAEHHVNNHLDNDPVFEELKSQIIEELAEGDLVHEFNIDDNELWNNIPMAVQKKPGKWPQHVGSST